MGNEMNIDDLLRYGERVTLECKDASGGIPKSVWETYSAFANTSGGNILLGIREDLNESDFEKRFTVSHLKNPARMIKEFWDTLNSAKVSVSVLVDDDVQPVSYRGETIVHIHVPQADYKKRPVYINQNPMKGTFKRNYEGDYHCTDEEVRAMLRDVNDSGNDGALLDGYTPDDIDLNALKAYRNEFAVRNPDHVWNGVDDKEFLRNFSCLSKDRGTGKEWLTTAGLLMFGKGLAIRERFDNIRMDYLDEADLQPGSRWSDRLTYDGMWENNLYTFFKKVMPKLTQDLKRPFYLEGITRIDDTPVHKALREAVINLIIHSDYLMSGVLKIVKRENEFLFSNPGNLKLPVREIYEGHNSKARNPRLQTLFRMLGFGDNIGSGFPTILNACKLENWRKPDLRENPELHQVELRIWMVSLMPQECTDNLRRTFGEAYDQLLANEQIILATACLEKEVSNNRLQSILDLHPTDIGRLLNDLTLSGLLIRNSKGRWTTYRLNAANGAEAELPLFSGTDQVDTDQVDTDQVGTDQVGTDQVGRTAVFSSRCNDILEFCRHSKTLQEILAHGNITSRVWLKKHYIDALISQGKLSMTIPDKPKSRLQKYVTTGVEK